MRRIDCPACGKSHNREDKAASCRARINTVVRVTRYPVGALRQGPPRIEGMSDIRREFAERHESLGGTQ